MLVAGTGYPGATWPRQIVEPLSQRCSVIVFDHRGTGASTSTPGFYSTRQFAKDALAVLDDADLGKAHVLGHSMGGRVAQWMAIDGSDHLSSLILAASGPGRIQPDLDPERGIPLVTAVALVEKGYERYLKDNIRDTFFTPVFAQKRPDIVSWLCDAFWEHRPALEDYLKHVIARQQHETADWLASIHIPALVLVGDRDTQGGAGLGGHVEQSKFLAARIAGAELVIIPGVSHGYFWEAPRPTLEALFGWLDSKTDP